MKEMQANMSTNTTVNEGQPVTFPNSFNPLARRIGETIVYCLLLVISLVGNTLIGIVVYRTRSLRKPINFFIVNMAMSDLIYSLFLFTPSITQLHLGSEAWLIRGRLGEALCKMTTFLADVSTGVSIQNLVLVAVDRFVAVIIPLRSPLISTKLSYFLIFASWIVAMAVYSPFFLTFTVVEYSGGAKCQRQWSEVFGDSTSFKHYILTLSILVFYIPLLSIAILYIAIFLKLKSQKTPGEQSDNSRKSRERRERNVLKMSIAIVFAFAICWLPFTSSQIGYLFLADRALISSCGYKIFTLAAFFLAVSYCAINPCICFIFNGNYRQGLKKLLSGSSVDNRVDPVPPAQ